MADYDDDVEQPKVAFGRWLLTQKDLAIGSTASLMPHELTARSRGTVTRKPCRRNVRKQQADRDAFAAVDDAEGDWMAA
jgi:hypothetical protein